MRIAVLIAIVAIVIAIIWMRAKRKE